MKQRAIIVGATSGIGLAVAKTLAAKGWLVGIAGRRTELLHEIQKENPNIAAVAQLDVTREDAIEKLHQLIGEMGGMDLYFHSSGIGYQNMALDEDKELRTVETNALGMTRMVMAAFKYFEQQRHGHIAVVSSIARTKGLGAAPAYSSTKRYTSHYLECLTQQAHMKGLKDLTITDIRPGFVRTPLIADGGHYPMQMNVDDVARKIVSGIERRKSVLTIDWKYRLLVGLWQWIPRWLWVRMNIRS